MKWDDGVTKRFYLGSTSEAKCELSKKVHLKRTKWSFMVLPYKGLSKGCEYCLVLHYFLSEASESEVWD